MSRNGIVGVASVIAVAALLSQPAFVSAQAGSTTDRKPAAASTSQKTSDPTPPLPPPGPTQADKPQAAAGTIGTVQVPHKVMADGSPLASGTYTLRVSNDPVTAVTGQTVEESKWIEFVQGGQVKAKVLATVVTNATAKQIADRGVPAAGAAKIQTLKGNDYLRIWIVRGPTSYLIHLANAAM